MISKRSLHELMVLSQLKVPRRTILPTLPLKLEHQHQTCPTKPLMPFAPMDLLKKLCKLICLKPILLMNEMEVEFNVLYPFMEEKIGGYVTYCLFITKKLHGLGYIQIHSCRRECNRNKFICGKISILLQYLTCNNCCFLFRQVTEFPPKICGQSASQYSITIIMAVFSV